MQVDWPELVDRLAGMYNTGL